VCGPLAGELSEPKLPFRQSRRVSQRLGRKQLTYKNDSQGIANLTPSSSYQCKTVNGEISWDYPSKVLTVNGTIFLDGSAKVDIGGVVSLQGTGNDLHLRHRAGEEHAAVRLQRRRVLHLRNWDSTKTCSASSRMATARSPPTARCRAVTASNSSAPTSRAPSTHQHHRDRHHRHVDGPLDGSTVILGQSSSPPSTATHSSPVRMPGNPTIFRARTDATSHRRLARKVPVLDDLLMQLLPFLAVAASLSSRRCGHGSGHQGTPSFTAVVRRWRPPSGSTSASSSGPPRSARPRGRDRPLRNSPSP